jgi:hypothetical protein
LNEEERDQALAARVTEAVGRMGEVRQTFGAALTALDAGAIEHLPIPDVSGLIAELQYARPPLTRRRWHAMGLEILQVMAVLRAERLRLADAVRTVRRVVRLFGRFDRLERLLEERAKDSGKDPDGWD